MNYSPIDGEKKSIDYNFAMQRNTVLVRFRSGSEETDRVIEALVRDGSFQSVRTFERIPAAAPGILTDDDARRLSEMIAAEESRDLWIVVDHPDLNQADFADIRADIAENPDRILAFDIRRPLPPDFSGFQKILHTLIEKSSLPLASVWYIPSAAARRVNRRGDAEKYFPLRWLLDCSLARIPVLLRSRRVGWSWTYRSRKFSLIALIWYYLNRLVRYSTASLFSVLLDYVVYMAALIFGGTPLAALIVGRISSTVFNFMLLRRFVYQDQSGKLGPTVVRYLTLTVFSTSLAYFTIEFIRALIPIPILVAKMIVETALFFFNFTMSRVWVFVGKRKKADG